MGGPDQSSQGRGLSWKGAGGLSIAWDSIRVSMEMGVER